ncbi:MAG: hypothetical protein GY697_00510 [Desulfobacterales bacterium]|nr:hypothetical protein [Desulfobacterales bacterium]
MGETDKKRSVLLLGATGLVGRQCLNLFLARGYFKQVITLSRRPLATHPVDPHHVDHVIDFDAPESYHGKLTADIVVCALGTTIKKAGSREMFRRVDFDYAFELSKAALENGAGHLLLVSAKGAAPDSRVFYNRVKGELEAAVSGLGFESLSIFRPSLLKGKRREFRAGEEVGNFLAGVFSIVIPAQWKPTPVDRLAEAILKAAINDHPGHRIYESGEILTDQA